MFNDLTQHEYKPLGKEDRRFSEGYEQDLLVCQLDFEQRQPPKDLQETEKETNSHKCYHLYSQRRPRE